MKRDDIRKLFPDATEDQITALLNQFNSETAATKNQLEQMKADSDKLKTDIEKYKADAGKVNSLEKRLTELKDAALQAGEAQKDAAEKQKHLDESSKRIAELETQVAEVQGQLKKAETMRALADRGIVGEDAEKFFNEDGTLNFETLGKVISDRETAAAEKKEQDIAKSSTNPNGGGEDSGDAKPYDVETAERIKFGGMSDKAKEARDYYR